MISFFDDTNKYISIVRYIANNNNYINIYDDEEIETSGNTMYKNSGYPYLIL